MKKIIFFLFVSFPVFSFAATSPEYTGGINNAMGSILDSKLSKTASANSAYASQLFNTLLAMKSNSTLNVGTAAAVGGVVASRVTWPMLLVSAGVAGVASGLTTLGADGLIKWMWPDSANPTSVKLDGEGMKTQAPVYSAGVTSGSVAWMSSCGGYWGSPQEAFSYCMKLIHVNYPTASFSNVSLVNTNSTTITASTLLNVSGVFTNYLYTATLTKYAYSGPTCLAGTGNLSGVCTSSGVTNPLNPFSTGNWVASWQTPANAINSLPDNSKNTVLSDEQLAIIVNTIWKASSATSGADTYKYSTANAITPAEVADWRKNNPTLAPTINDFISPVQPESVTQVPLPAPTPSTTTGTTPTSGTTPVSGTTSTSVSVDFGSFSPPELESTPTTASILDPIFNMFPQWQNFAFPAHESRCPRPSFEVLGHVFVFDHMCSWVEMIRPFLEAAFALCWAVAVLFIILGA